MKYTGWYQNEFNVHNRARLASASITSRSTTAQPESEIHRVDPELASRPRSLTESPYQSLEVGPKFWAGPVEFTSRRELRRERAPRGAEEDLG